MRPSFCKNCSPSKIEGAGNAGRLMRPRPRVRNKIKHTSVVTTVTPVSPGIPRAMVLTAYFVLSPATNSSCHRHPRIKVLSKARSGRLASANLTPATGARTTRLCRPLKRRSSCTLADRSRGSSRPATACAPDALASTASRPAFVTTRDPPLCGTGWRDHGIDLGQTGNKIYLQKGLDRHPGKTRSDLPVRHPAQAGASSTPRLFHFINGFSGILDRPPARAMTAERVARFRRAKAEGGRRNSPLSCR